MKNTLLILSALAALALASCTKVENFSSRENSGNEIGFATYTGRALTKSGTALGQSFNVESFLSGTPASRYFHSTSYRFASNRYTGDTTRYWPVTGNLDFYAVSPLQYMNTSGTAVDLKPVDSTFTVTKTDGKTDIVAARLVNVPNGLDPVTLEFGHKLTKVSFKAVGFDATKNYKISSITVVANSSAKYSFGADSWTDSTDTHEYTFLDECKSIPVSTTTPVALGDTLFLIPSQAATIKAQIRYSIYDGAIKIDTTVAPVEVNLPVSGVWGINKSVVYKLTLNISSSTRPINFSATVEDWDADRNYSLSSSSYVENGVDYGPGILVDGVVWAPVNCGYDSVYFKYGKLYQFNRVKGCGWIGRYPSADDDAGGVIQAFCDDPATTNNPADDTFYKGDANGDWYSGTPFTEWYENASGGIGNPCPEGWRVPTIDEFGYLLFTNYNPLRMFSGGDIFTDRGHWDSEKNEWNFENGVVFPAAGHRDIYVDGFGANRRITGEYWSSSVSSASHETSIGKSFMAQVSISGNCIFIGGRAYGFSVRCVAK